MTTTPKLLLGRFILTQVCAAAIAEEGYVFRDPSIRVSLTGQLCGDDDSEGAIRFAFSLHVETDDGAGHEIVCADFDFDPQAEMVEMLADAEGFDRARKFLLEDKENHEFLRMQDLGGLFSLIRFTNFGEAISASVEIADDGDKYLSVVVDSSEARVPIELIATTDHGRQEKVVQEFLAGIPGNRLT